MHSDLRGTFLEAFTASSIESATGRAFSPVQVNTSVSRRGVIRGIHASRRPPSQAKYVMCVAGAILDVAVDLRYESPTFGQWESIQLDDVSRRAIFIAEGLGHAFCVLSSSATVVYLTSTPFDQKREFNVHPMDEDIAIPWPHEAVPVLSPRDAQAPKLRDILREPDNPLKRPS